MRSLIPLITLLLAPSAFAVQTGQYVGTNQSAWFYKHCRLDIYGASADELYLVSVADSDHAYNLKLESESFTRENQLSGFLKLNYISSEGTSIYDRAATNEVTDESYVLTVTTGPLEEPREFLFRHRKNGTIVNEIQCRQLENIYKKSAE